MSEFIGREIEFGIASESTRGTAESSADRNVRKVTANLTPKVEKVIDDTSFGRLEDSASSRVVRKWSEGDIEGIVHADVIGFYLNNLYGDLETTEIETDVYSHVFNLGQNIKHPSLTFFIKDAGVRQLKVPGAMLSTFEITATTDSFVRYTANLMGRQSETDNSTFPALQTENDFIGKDITVKIATTEAGLSSASALKIKDLNISFETNVEADFVFGNYSPNDVYNKQFSISGTFTKNFENTIFEDLYNSDDFRYLSVKIVGEQLIGTENPTIELVLNKVSVTEHERTSASDDLVTETVSFKAFYNVADEKQSQVTIINETITY
jgi:hypothetical protein